MRELLITGGNDAVLLPILEALIAKLGADEERHRVARIVYMELRTMLTFDLTRVQYEYMAREAVVYWSKYVHRQGNDTGIEAKMSWIIRLYILREYFAAGLFFDDIRDPKDVCNYLDEVAVLPYLLGNWTVVRTYEEFVRCISKDSAYERISFDHDLGEDKYGRELPSGYDALKWLVERLMTQELPLPEVLCHSQNPVGKANIMGYWDSFRRSLQVG